MSEAAQHLREELAKVKAELEDARTAFEDIRDNEGKVCADFELCNHASCLSSYGAWVVADEFLRTHKSEDEGAALLGIKDDQG